MTTQHSDPPRDRTDTGPEVLSDTTDLDTLLEAILGDEVAPVETHRESADESTARAVAADPLPALVAIPPPSARVDPEPAFASDVVVADDDAWGFVSEDPQAGDEVARDFTPVRDEAPAVASAGSVPTWRDKLRVSWSRQWLLVAALSAAALITASAITLREEPTATQTVASSDAAAPVESSPPIQNASAVKATNASEVEVWAAAREPEQPSRVISRPAPRRSNDAPGGRASTPAKPAFVETARNAPVASPAIASPPVVERITPPTDRDAAPNRTALPAESEPRRIPESAPAGVANGTTAVNAAEPVRTAAAPAPPAVPQRTAGAAAPAPAAVPQRTAARLVTGPAPEYPVALRTARIGGSVEVLLTIDATGRVVKAQSLTGHPQLRSAAEAAAKRWRYEAARLDNLAVETQTMVRFNFDPSTERRPQE